MLLILLCLPLGVICGLNSGFLKLKTTINNLSETRFVIEWGISSKKEPNNPKTTKKPTWLLNAKKLFSSLKNRQTIKNNLKERITIIKKRVRPFKNDQFYHAKNIFLILFVFIGLTTHYNDCVLRFFKQIPWERITRPHYQNRFFNIYFLITELKTLYKKTP